MVEKSAGEESLAHNQLRQLLMRMHSEGLAGRRDPIDTDYVILVRTSLRGSLSAGRVRRSLIEEGLRTGCLVKTRQGLFELVHGMEIGVVASAIAPEPIASPRINDAESPLLWLYRRKGQDGLPLIDELSYLAGERFRRDVTQASLLPSVTTNWSRMEHNSGSTLPRDPANGSDVSMAARQRVRAAFQVLGTDMGHFVLDVCAFLMPLREAEAKRNWPQRSAKLVLRMALTRLAEHYGLSLTARGVPSATMQSWQMDPQRMSIEAWLSQPTSP